MTNNREAYDGNRLCKRDYKWQNCVEQIIMERRKLVYKFKEFLKATRKQKT